jgi:cation/acetate symporter
VNVVRGGHADGGEELRVARIATIVLGLVAMGLGVLFKGQNVAFMVALAFAIAASGNFPALLLSIFWPRYTTGGAVATIWVGTLTTVALIWFSPTLQVDILHRETAPFALRNPALITIPLAFAIGWVVSRLSAEPQVRERFAQIARRMHLGSEEGS